MKYLMVVLVALFCVSAGAQKSVPCTEAAITEFKIYNRDLPLDSILQLQTIELSPDQNSFSISFAPTNRSSHDSSTYYYKLEGADKNWIKTGASTTVNYTLLRPGSYNFKITCNRENLSAANTRTALHLVIRIPFWLSSWFIILCCMVFVGIAYFLHTLSIKRLMAIEAIRQKVSRDLHDDIGSTLSTINILSAMAKTKMLEDPVKSGEYINKISDNCSRLMETMDDIVWSINPVNDSMQKIFSRMRAFATELLEPKEMTLQFHFDEEANDIALDMERRRDIFLIFKEAVNNIAKYSNATRVDFNVTCKKHILIINITDNGIGFDIQNADNGNGLNNMQKRAEKLNAKFNISSAPGNGTAIRLEMQIT